MQNPNEDTEWNDVLRAKGILPPVQKEAEITEEAIVSMLEDTIQSKINAEKPQDLHELELEDLDDEAVFEEYRRKRLAEMRRQSVKPRYGEVVEISGQDYKREVNEAGKGVWVVLHLYRQGVPMCALVNQHLTQLAAKFPYTKFLKAVAQTCIPNYPEKNLPTMFVYYEGALKTQFIGPVELRGTNLKCPELEYMLGKANAVETTITEDPRQRIKDKMFSELADNEW